MVSPFAFEKIKPPLLAEVEPVRVSTSTFCADEQNAMKTKTMVKKDIRIICFYEDKLKVHSTPLLAQGEGIKG
jgi:hypothetical protein